MAKKEATISEHAKRWKPRLIPETSSQCGADCWGLQTTCTEWMLDIPTRSQIKRYIAHFFWTSVEAIFFPWKTAVYVDFLPSPYIFTFAEETVLK